MKEVLETDAHFDPEEMSRFAFDPAVPKDRELWITTEPGLQNDLELIQHILEEYDMLHPDNQQ